MKSTNWYRGWWSKLLLRPCLTLLRPKKKWAAPGGSVGSEGPIGGIDGRGIEPRSARVSYSLRPYRRSLALSPNQTPNGVRYAYSRALCLSTNARAHYGCIRSAARRS